MAAARVLIRGANIIVVLKRSTNPASIRNFCSPQDNLHFQPSDGIDLSKSFAQLSLPSQFYLHYSERDPASTSSTAVASATASSDEMSGPRVLVRAESGIFARTQLGPLQGEAILEKDIPEDFQMKDLWQIFAEDAGKPKGECEEGEVGHRRRFLRLYVSTVNPEKSNWLRYVRPAPNRRARNVAAIVEGDQLYFVTLRDLKKDEEVLYWIDDPDLMWTKKRAEKKSKGCSSQLNLAQICRIPRHEFLRLQIAAAATFDSRTRYTTASIAPSSMTCSFH